MDYASNIAGHKRQLEFLMNAASRGKLAHAYIFAGPEGVGKKTVALALAKVLLTDTRSTPPLVPTLEGEGNSNPQYFHPDYLEVSDENGIKVEQVRELIYKLSLKPYQAQYKVAVIDNAESMTVEAANALLKNLEEPKSYTIIILITSAPDKLLKTISSRAQKINFGPVAYEEYSHLLPDKLSKEQKQLIASYGQSRPGLALNIAGDVEFMEKVSTLDAQFKVFRSKDESERLLLVNDLAQMETAEIRMTLIFWTGKLQAEFWQNPDSEKASFLKSLSQASALLDANLNSKLLLTNLMLNNINA